MKLKQIIILLSFGIIMFFSFIGMMFISTLVHELSHKQDFEHFVISDDICLMTYNSSDFGFYTFSYENNQTIKINAIEKYTEYKAYSINTIIMFLFLIAVLFIIYKLKMNSGC